MYYLFLDDVREPAQVTWVKLPPFVSWTIVRNYNQFVEAVTRDGLPEFVTFDHNLTDESYSGYYRPVGERTGYHCAKFMVKYCKENRLAFPRYTVHSMNLTGKADIVQMIEQFKHCLINTEELLYTRCE